MGSLQDAARGTKLFRDLLALAEGDSRFVVAAFADIRSFTSFFPDNVEGAYFLREAYGRILEDYFPEASFAKPTGDGLLIVQEVDRQTVRETTVAMVSKSLDLFQNFARLLEADPMVTSKKPHSIGVGLARGTAIRLYSGDTTLDYSGRTLNLAARLMDLARPEGVVVDQAMGELLPDNIRQRFEEAAVYVRGVSPRSAVRIRYTKSYTLLPESARRPLEGPIWKAKTEDADFNVLTQAGGKAFLVSLPERPSTPEAKVEVDFWTLMADGSRSPVQGTAHFAGTLNYQGERCYAQVDAKEVIGKLRAARVDASKPIKLTVHYAL